MKLKFKIQPYQTDAVAAVVDCFAGQPFHAGVTYRMDPGTAKQQALDESGFKNADLMLTDGQILANIQAVQRRQNLLVSPSLTDFQEINKKGETVPAAASYKRDALATSRVHLDIEMETGTGKTYCYIKTMFALNKQYGWNKFIIIVPTIAIREGVYKSLEITAQHFAGAYGKKARFFIYNSRQLHHLESFSSDAGINVMVMNIQAFNTRGADGRRIYDALDDFQSRRPIDVISSNRPILILDEPQKMEGKATLECLPKFKPLAILRYSATHKTTHNKIYRLDALDAYNQKLVKKITVRGISIKGLTGTNAYLYLESIEISKQAPVARIEMEIRTAGQIKRQIRRLGKGDNLYDLSNNLDQYKGFVIAQIDAVRGVIEFSNGHILEIGEATGDVTETAIRRIQIRETIKAHFEKERQLFQLGIKVLSLFFIDEVAKYRDYSQPDEQGEYARIFEEEYQFLKDAYLSELALENDAYRAWLAGIDVSRTHEGYFSIDRKTKRLKNPDTKEKSSESDDVDAYDLILRKKERLLSFAEPVRFIFSHSALREGWDNPNVFVMCMLKHSDNSISRRQEVGRGLRLCVNQNGDRMDHPGTVHDINILTVVASESYKTFVDTLQKEISEALSARPRKADAAYFTGKLLQTDSGTVTVTEAMAQDLEFYLIQNRYIDRTRHIADAYHAAKSEGALAPLPDTLAPYAAQILQLVDSVFSPSQMPGIGDDRKTETNRLNANFNRREFQELWQRINKKAIYRVDFDSGELVQNAVAALNRELRVKPLTVVIETGVQKDGLTDDLLRGGLGFRNTITTTEVQLASVHSKVTYDLVGKVAETVQLTRQTVAGIFRGMEPAIFAQFRQNPEHFIAEASRLIQEQKAAVVIKQLTYDEIAGQYESDIFTAGEAKLDITRAGEKMQKHIYDYVVTDSDKERKFVDILDTCTDVVVYAKLPRGFEIPTPVGNYNPDWAIAFREGTVRHIYFIAETKGGLASLELRPVEQTKIKCARQFFAAINQRIESGQVQYGVIDGFDRLMDLVGLTSGATRQGSTEACHYADAT